MRTLTRRLGRPGSASASRHRQCTQQAQHADVSEDASHVCIGASQMLRLGSWRRGSRRRRCGQGSGRSWCRRSRRSRCGRWCRFSRRSLRDWRGKCRGFSLHEAFWQRVIGVSDPRVVQFPHLVAVRSRHGVLGSRVSRNFARNSIEGIPSFEGRSLESQRFLVCLKNDRWKICAKFVGRDLAVAGGARRRYSQATPSLSRSRFEL